MASSLNGWALVPPLVAKLRTWRFPLATGRVRKKSVWVILYRFARLYAELVEPIDVTKSWGWSYRKVKGYGNSSKWSNHASATAIDLNAHLHPQGRRRTFTPEQWEAVRALLDRFGGVIRWGAVFEKPDEMHFEISPYATVAQVQALATRILQRALVDAGYHLGTTGPGRDGVDGDRGAKTTRAVKALQRSHGILATGIDTPATWAALLSERNTSL